jgi:hypothetical protein
VGRREVVSEQTLFLGELGTVRRGLTLASLCKGSCMVCRPRIEELTPVVAVDWAHGSLVLCRECAESLRKMLGVCRG